MIDAITLPKSSVEKLHADLAEAAEELTRLRLSHAELLNVARMVSDYHDQMTDQRIWTDEMRAAAPPWIELTDILDAAIDAVSHATTPEPKVGAM